MFARDPDDLDERSGHNESPYSQPGLLVTNKALRILALKIDLLLPRQISLKYMNAQREILFFRQN